ncbi:colicin immunity domain-containing protein [Pedobacter steynii]
MEVPEFEELFMQIKADDEYWRSGMFDQKIAEVLDTLFLDIRDYSLDYLYDRNDFVNVNLISFNEAQVMLKAQEALSKLKESINTY